MAADPPIAQPARRRAAVVFIFITLVLDVLAMGITIPVLPRLVQDMVGGDTAGAARIFGWFGTIFALMQFVTGPILGALSDRIGRRPVILLSNLGLGLDYVLMALAPDLAWLFLGRVVAGITAASFPAAAAYIADVTPAERRSKAYGLLGAAFGLGFVLGPALGGLLGGVDPRLPFWVAAACSLVNFSYGVLVLPESLPRERRMPFAWRRANPVASLILLRRHPELSGLAVANFVAAVAHESLPSTFVLYAGYRYGWDARAVGLTLAAVGVASALVQSLLIGPAVRRLGDRGAAILGLALGSLGMVVYGCAGSGWIFLAGIPLMALWGLSGPAFSGLMTRHVGPSEQGQLQGALTGLHGVAGLFSPALFASVFAACIAGGLGPELPGAPFLLSAILLAAAVAVTAWATRRRRIGPEQEG